MDSKDMGELLSRIDERTSNMYKRQEEEIIERKGISKRVDLLENWRSGLSYAYGVGVLAIGYILKTRHHDI